MQKAAEISSTGARGGQKKRPVEQKPRHVMRSEVGSSCFSKTCGRISEHVFFFKCMYINVYNTFGSQWSQSQPYFRLVKYDDLPSNWWILVSIGYYRGILVTIGEYWLIYRLILVTRIARKKIWKHDVCFRHRAVVFAEDLCLRSSQRLFQLRGVGKSPGCDGWFAYVLIIYLMKI